MADVVWTGEAIDQLDLIVTYIEAFDRRAATQLRRRLFDIARNPRDFPHGGRPVEGARRELTTVPPNVMRYRVSGDIVYIVSVRHGARRPD